MYPSRYPRWNSGESRLGLSVSEERKGWRVSSLLGCMAGILCGAVGAGCIWRLDISSAGVARPKQLWPPAARCRSWLRRFGFGAAAVAAGTGTPQAGCAFFMLVQHCRRSKCIDKILAFWYNNCRHADTFYVGLAQSTIKAETAVGLARIWASNRLPLARAGHSKNSINSSNFLL